MKTTFIFTAFLLLSTQWLSAQPMTEEIDFYQSIFGMEKKAYVAEFIPMQTETAMVFWDIYNKYEAERKALGKKRIDLLLNYADKYETLSDQDTDQLIKDVMVQRKSLDKTIEKYYKQLKKNVGSQEAAQFYQIENYVLSAIRLSILESIPFFGE